MSKPDQERDIDDRCALVAGISKVLASVAPFQLCLTVCKSSRSLAVVMSELCCAAVLRMTHCGCERT